MSFNGSGTFVINSAGQPVVSGTVISSTAFNALTADLANGLSTCITKDGQTTPTADIPMGSNKITGLANGTAAGDAANLGQVQSTVAKLLGSVSGADTITAVGAPTVAAYAAGQMFYFVAAAANTGAVTINIDSLGAKSITRDGTTALAAGDIQSGEVCVIVYDGTQFQLVNGASQSASIVTENLTVNKATVLNESGGDNDTRIEGNGDSHLLFADANENAVGVSTGGNALDDFKFEVVGNKAIGGVRISDTFDANGYEIVTGTTNIITAYNRGTATWLPLRQRANQHEFYCDGVETLRLSPAGNLGLNVTPSAWQTDIKAIQIGDTGSQISGSNAAYSGANNLWIGNNSFQNSSVQNVYVRSAAAALYELNGNNHKWYTAPSGTAGNTITFTQAMTLDASGNLLVNTTTSGQGKLMVKQGASSVAGGIALQATSTDSYLGIWNDGSVFNIDAYYSSTGSYQPIAFRTSNTERARITSGGDFLIGATSDGTFGGRMYVEGGQGPSFVSTGAAANQTLALWQKAGTGDNLFINFYTETASPTGRGSIDYNRAAGLTRYNTTSDYRAKDVYGFLENTGNAIDSLKVYNGKMKGATQERPMLIAHEAQEVAPYAVSGVKDEENENGTPKYQQIDHSSLVPLLIAEIQSLRARVAALEA
jgi:hypothetical protein